MRRLHATGLRERFVASGVYAQPDGLLEHWSAHEVGAGALFLRVDRDGRAAGGPSLLQEALRNADGNFERIDQQHYDAGGRPGARLRCTRFAGHVELSLENVDCPRDEQIDMGPDYVLIPPGILLAGMALARAQRLQQPVALLRMTLDADRFAWGRSSAVACCEQCGEMQAGERALTARRCGWSDSLQTCWLDAHDVALRCEAAGQSFRLTQYSRRHD